MAQKVRIKDIAEKSGVSVGTVDRILHNRPNVSKSAREKVEKVLKEINYQPNMYASALAYNKSYTFYLIMPKHESEAYWQEIEHQFHQIEGLIVPKMLSLNLVAQYDVSDISHFSAFLVLFLPYPLSNFD